MNIYIDQCPEDPSNPEGPLPKIKITTGFYVGGSYSKKKEKELLELKD